MRRIIFMNANTSGYVKSAFLYRHSREIRQLDSHATVDAPLRLYAYPAALHFRDNAFPFLRRSRNVSHVTSRGVPRLKIRAMKFTPAPGLRIARGTVVLPSISRNVL